MTVVETFVHFFVEKLFDAADTEVLRPYLSEDISAVCFLGGEKAVGIEAVLQMFSPKHIPFDICKVKEVQITNPAKDLYCVTSACDTVRVDTALKAELSVTLTMLAHEEKYHILQIHISQAISPGEEECTGDVIEEIEELKRNLEDSRARLEVAIQHSSLSIWEYDMEKQCIYQKDNSMAIHGFSSVIENVPQSLVESEYIHPDSAEGYLMMYQNLREGKHNVNGIFRVLNIDRTEYWWEKTTYFTVYNEDHRPVRAIGFSTDVTEQMRLQEELQRVVVQKEMLSQNAIVSAVVDITEDWVLDIDARDVYSIDVSKITNYKSLRDALEIVIVDQCESARILREVKKETLIKQYEEGRGQYRYEFLYRLPDGQEIWARMSFLVEENPYNGHVIATGYLEDVDAWKRKEMELRADSQQDDLTQIYNRTTFEMLVAEELKMLVPGRMLAFGILDLDNFKSINDIHGHLSGDAALKKVANVLKVTFRQNDFVGRLGGDEFVFSLTDVMDLEFLEQRMEQVAEMLAAPDEQFDKPLYASVGIAVAPRDGSTFEVLYKKADMALYCAKNDGKNKCYMYTEG